MFRHSAIETYLSDAASGQPTPGGGSVSALVGALAAAMSEMSANFTSGKKKFASVAARIDAALGELVECRRLLLAAMDRDAEAYAAVGAAYAMPRETDEQKAARKRAIAAALRDAMQVPLAVMRECAHVARVAETLVDIGNPNLITDVGVSAVLAEAACAAARFNVEVNLKYLRQPGVAAETLAEMDELSTAVRACRRDVTDKVNAYLRG